MSTILLSFDWDVFNRLEFGNKKIEYMKHFPEGDVTAYFYVCRPVQAISGIAHFDTRISMNLFMSWYQGNSEAINKLSELNLDNNFAVPIKSFQPTNKIFLPEIKEKFPDFLIPRMYYFLDKKTEILSYLEKHIYPKGKIIQFDTSEIKCLSSKEL